MTVRFPDQRPDEQVLLIVRPHWLMLLPAIILTVLLSLLPPIVFAVMDVSDITISDLGTAAAAALVSAYYLTLVTYFYIRWVDYYLDVGIVTDSRIVDIDQLGLFRRNVDELDCKMVQDVAVTRHGIFQTLFNFGTLEIQTAGERRNFEFKGIPKPEEVQHLIAKAQGAQEEKKAEKEAKPEAAAAPQGPQPSPAPAPPQPAKPDEQKPKDPPPPASGLPREFE